MSIPGTDGPARAWLALAAGCAWPLAFEPVGQSWLSLVLPALLLLLWRGVGPRRAALLGLLFGLGAFGLGVHWIYFSLHDYGEAAAPFAALATLVLVLVVAAYPALLGWLLVRLTPGDGPLRWLAFPLLWVLLEGVREHLWVGFPWLFLGYAHSDGLLGAWAPVAGVLAVSLAGACLSAALVALLLGRRRQRLVAGSVVVALVFGSWLLDRRDWVLPAGEPLDVALVQASIPQQLKWQPEQLMPGLLRHAELSAGSGKARLIVWPETAIPTLPESVAGFLQPLDRELADAGVALLAGAPTRDADGGFRNSVIALGAAQGAYHKRHLVPFGEYLPLRWALAFFHRFVTIPMSDFTAGNGDQPLMQVAGLQIGTSICFEAAFGSLVRAALPAAELLVNVSNDAWFGDSLAPGQNLQMAALRARETGRYLLRATNTGISAVVDPRGRVIARVEPFKAAILAVQVRPYQGVTPFVRWGELPLWLLLAGSAAALLALGRRSRSG